MTEIWTVLAHTYVYSIQQVTVEQRWLAARCGTGSSLVESCNVVDADTDGCPRSNQLLLFAVHGDTVWIRKNGGL